MTEVKRTKGPPVRESPLLFRGDTLYFFVTCFTVMPLIGIFGSENSQLDTFPSHHPPPQPRVDLELRERDRLQQIERFSSVDDQSVQVINGDAALRAVIHVVTRGHGRTSRRSGILFRARPCACSIPIK